MSDIKATNITWHDHHVTKEERIRLKGHRGAVLWFTGLSGSGKSSIANVVDHILHRRGVHSFVLDGDNIRHGLNSNLGFSAEDRAENIRRIGEVAKILADSGTVALTAFISPYRADRDRVRALLAPGEFVEIYVDASLDTCESRDPKGLYKKARAGEIKGFTGIDDPYEAPLKPEIVLDSNRKGIEALANEVIEHLARQGILTAQEL
jgi:adenylylsulfate kinase